MKKLFLGVGIVLVALLGAVLIVPSFINWNDYKPEIAAQAKKATGRALAIDGDIRIAILPAPALVVNNVKFANAKGAADAEMARFKSVEVRMAMRPLLQGKIQFETIKLVEPVVSLEILKDGRKNWDFQAQGETATTGQTTIGKPRGRESASSGISLSLDNVIVQNGNVVFRDSKAKSTERIENINARIAVASLTGPFETSGSLLARGLPFKIDATVGKIIEGRTAPVNANIGVAGGAAKIQASGSLTNLNESPTFKAKVSAEGKSLAEVVHTVVKTGALPGAMGQPFRIEADVNASAAASSVSGLVVRLGDTQAKGMASLTTDQKTKLPNIIAKLAINQIDLDKLLALPAVKPTQKKKSKKQSWLGVGRAHAAKTKKAKPNEVNIPANILASFNLNLDRLIYRGGVIRQTKANVELANGEITISQVSAQLPGTTDVALFGFLTAKNGIPKFDGEIEAAASNVRGVAKWLGVKMPKVPSGRLRRVTFAGKFSATPNKVDVAGLDMQFDSSRLTGAATVALRQPVAFGANLVLDRLNLDAYMVSEGNNAQKKSKAKPAKTDPKSTSEKPSAPTNPLAVLSVLKSFDANVKAHVRTLVYQGNQIRDIVLDGTLFNNTLDIRRASINRFSGASVNLKGKVEKLVGLPTLKNVRLTFNAPNIHRLFRAAGLNTPATLQKVGKVTLTGQANGSIFKPKLDTRLQAAGADVKAVGSVSALPVVGGIDLRLTAKHGNLARLLRTLKIDYRPSGRLGGLDLVTDVKGDAKTISLQNIKAKIGKLSIEGLAGIDLKGARPKLNANLTTGALIIDHFLPAQRRASLVPSIRAAWRAPYFDRSESPLMQRIARRTSRSQRRWSTDPIDLSGLKAFDATVGLKAPSVTFDKYRLSKADIALTLANGILQTNRLTGLLYGGTLQGQATVNATKTPQANIILNVKNTNVSQIEKALSRGRASVNVNLATNGNSIYQMVSRLNGKGSFVLEGLDVRSGGGGSAMSGMLDLVLGLNQLGGQLTGSRKGKGLADATGSFVITNGIARTQDIKLLSSVGNGEAKGFVDLPRWNLDVSGQVDLTQNLLTQLLKRGQKSTTAVPFRVYGRLDKPNVKLKAPNLGGALPIPGLDKVIKKQPGVGKLLDQIIPGLGGGGSTQQQQPQTQQQQQPQQQQQQQQQPQQKQKVRPEDILKDLFGIR